VHVRCGAGLGACVRTVVGLRLCSVCVSVCVFGSPRLVAPPGMLAAAAVPLHDALLPGWQLHPTLFTMSTIATLNYDAIPRYTLGTCDPDASCPPVVLCTKTHWRGARRGAPLSAPRCGRAHPAPRPEPQFVRHVWRGCGSVCLWLRPPLPSSSPVCLGWTPPRRPPSPRHPSPRLRAAHLCPRPRRDRCTPCVPFVPPLPSRPHAPGPLAPQRWRWWTCAPAP
jgi:hypothetical protein